MKEAFGGIINIVFISIFLVIVIGVLGLVVSYTKAFRMKNAIISVIEEYEGSGCYPEISGGTKDSACRRKIKEQAESLKYNPVALNCSGTDLYKADDVYCYSMEKKSGDTAVFRVITQVDIGFPIVEDIMGMRFFQVTGDTKIIKLQY